MIDRIKIKIIAPVIVSAMMLVSCNGMTIPADTRIADEPLPSAEEQGVSVTQGTSEIEGFSVDNVMHFSDGLRDLHFHLYIPPDYDGSKPYALYITLPGHGAYIYRTEDIGLNLTQEGYAVNSRKYNDRMIVAAVQLEDIEGEFENIEDEFDIHVEQVIRLTEYLISNYNIDRDKVCISGYSRGGRVMSRICARRPDLYRAVLDVSSDWETDISVIVKNSLPVYFVIGEEDEAFGSDPFRNTYEEIVSMYKEEGLSEEEIGKLVVLDIKGQEYFEGKDCESQHIGGEKLFSEDESVMGWLFDHDR